MIDKYGHFSILVVCLKAKIFKIEYVFALQDSLAGYSVQYKFLNYQSKINIAKRCLSCYRAADLSLLWGIAK